LVLNKFPTFPGAKLKSGRSPEKMAGRAFAWYPSQCNKQKFTDPRVFMKNLFKGILDFQRADFESHRELFNDLGRGQNPHTLFIGCSDSRVVPTLITKTNPGELFLIRNIANIVPPYSTDVGFSATSSTIEYAVLALGVDTIVVCGHSNCGGCYALNQPIETLKDMPNMRKWLEIVRHVPEKVSRLMHGNSAAEREWLTEKVNVLEQVKNLLTYPYVKERVDSGSLQLLGWYYIIETGEVFNFNDDSGHFELISSLD
jgi:carbonic anhydrase